MEFKIFKYKAFLQKSHLRELKVYRPVKSFLLILAMLAFYIPLKAQKEIHAVVSHSSFYLPATAANHLPEPFMELYWQIDAASLPFAKEQDIWRSRIKTDIVIKNDTGIVYQDHYVLETNPKKEVADALAQNVIDLRRFKVPAGRIHLKLELSDLIAKDHYFLYTDSLTIDAADAQPLYSDLQLIDTIINTWGAKETNIFQRNDRIQIPLCSGFIGENKKKLVYYAELYNTGSLTAEEFPLIQKVYISRKEQGNMLQDLHQTDTIAAREVVLVNGSIPTETLASGNYYLNVALENNKHQKIASKYLFFQLLNPHPVAAKTTVAPRDTSAFEAVTSYLNLNKTFAGKYTSSQIRAILKMLYPICDPSERLTISGFLKKPDEMYMRYFIYNFWLRKDGKNPEQAWKKYTEKIKEVNKLFGSASLPGYETDRGSIYLRFGKPDEIAPVPNEEGALPYEIWQYNSTEKRGSPGIFLFYRPGFMINDYKLLHSTVPGEVRNASWRRVLYESGQASDNLNSRAEQYLGTQ